MKSLAQLADNPVAYLCGQDPVCKVIGSQQAVAIAKENVEEFYPVLGVLELLSKWHPSTCMSVYLLSIILLQT